MKSLFALAFLCLGFAGCVEESKVRDKVTTPGGSTTTETKVDKTGDNKTSP